MLQDWRSKDLGGLEIACWEALHQGAKDRRSPLHSIIFSTVHGNEPRLRTVVLRRVDVVEKRVYAHVDMRSPKAADVLTNPNTSWLAYEPEARAQIRLSGLAVIHNQDELCRKHWQATGHHSRRFYMRPQEAQPLSEPQALQEDLKDFKYSDEDTEVAFKDFGVIRCDVTFMDIYGLHHEGNRRAEFYYENGSLIIQQWMSA